ncbi:MAG TPA: TetR/AcrR family transcriptional regulator [Chloroflexia bacterium]|nr:TetR/AcrR family transcriptional regulator [Chloroflexia bacterium]
MSTPKENTDLRVRRTQTAIREALLSLIEEKGFEAIIVQDIADRAMINRVTFYKHYRDKYDLLEKTMNEMYQELMARVKVAPSSPPDRVIFNLLVLWLEEVIKYASFYRTMLGKEGSPAFTSQVRKQLGSLIADAVEQLSTSHDRNDTSFTIQLQFTIGGFLSVTEWWLDRQPSMPIEQVASQLQHLLFRVINYNL